MKADDLWVDDHEIVSHLAAFVCGGAQQVTTKRKQGTDPVLAAPSAAQGVAQAQALARQQRDHVAKALVQSQF